jgi:hypothetical protein
MLDDLPILVAISCAADEVYDEALRKKIDVDCERVLDHPRLKATRNAVDAPTRRTCARPYCPLWHICAVTRGR